jgi:hypothetical protein
MQATTNVKYGITFSNSDKNAKTHKAIFKDGTVAHFGHSVGAWSHKDHGDETRRENYHKRHGCSKEKTRRALTT